MYAWLIFSFRNAKVTKVLIQRILERKYWVESRSGILFRDPFEVHIESCVSGSRKVPKPDLQWNVKTVDWSKLARRGRLKASTTIFVCHGAFVPYNRWFETNEDHPIETDFKTYSIGRGYIAISKATAIFTNLESLIYHLRQPFGPSKNIVNYFTKSLSKGATASAVLTSDKPSKMDSDAKNYDQREATAGSIEGTK